MDDGMMSFRRFPDDFLTKQGWRPDFIRPGGPCPHLGVMPLKPFPALTQAEWDSISFADFFTG